MISCQESYGNIVREGEIGSRNGPSFTLMISFKNPEYFGCIGNPAKNPKEPRRIWTLTRKTRCWQTSFSTKQLNENSDVEEMATYLVKNVRNGEKLIKNWTKNGQLILKIW